MKMKFIVIHKDYLVNIPPVISVILNLLDLGHEVTLIDHGVNEHWDKILKDRGVKVYSISPSNQNILSKINSYRLFRSETFKILKTEYSEDNTILWIEGAPTIFALGEKINNFKFILQISELHERQSYQLRAISKVIHNAQIVFMPEYNRSVIYQVWFKLKNRPTVLPNKPYFLPSVAELDKLSSKYQSYVKSFEGKKIILYQGLVSSERDLTNYIKAVADLNNEYVFVIIGKDFGVINKYRRINPNIVHIDFIPAPDYLFFTKIAYIGIVTYKINSLNTAYCAPNKIWEYSYYGLPMIGNDIPGLKYTIFNDNAGIAVNEDDKESIKKAILAIDKDYDLFSHNSRMFFNNIDSKQIIQEALTKIKR